MIAEHGFRIVDNTVEADAAAPRICLNFSDQLAAEPRLFADFVSVEGGSNLAVEAGGQQICIDGVEHGRRYHRDVRAGLPAADGETLHEERRARHLRARPRALRRASSAPPTCCRPAASRPSRSSPSTPTASNAKLYRIGDRQLADTIADGTFLSQLCLLGDRRDRGEVGREGLGRHGRRRERDQPRDHDRDSRSASSKRSSSPAPTS